MNANLELNHLEIIRKHQHNAPVKVVDIAIELGLAVYSATYNSDNLSGKIILDKKYGGPCGYAIFVNADHSKNRQRFTIAHEVAHYLLHKDQIGDGIIDDALYRSGLSNKQEVEANKLAADILMPWLLIYKFMDDKIKSIADLASIFQVSESAMSIRLGIPC